MQNENTILRRFERIANLVDDDFVTDPTKLFYLNQAKREVIAFYITRELEILRDRGHVGSLRILDNIRKTEEYTNITPVAFKTDWVFRAVFNVPIDMERQLAVHVNGLTPAVEITPSRRYELLHRMNRIGEYQGCYEFLERGWPDNKIILYTGTDDTVDVELQYFRKPTEINTETESLVDIPDYLQTAVYIGAGWLLSVQDRDRTINDFTRDRFFYELNSKMF